MHASPRRIAALLSLTVCAAFGATAGQASAATQSRGLLDLGGVIGGVLGSLTSVLNGLLGTAQLAPLTSLTSSLTPGVTPSAQTLAPLTPLVQGVAGNAATPAALKTQAAGVLAILNSGSSTPLSPDALGQVTGLLGTLSLTNGLSAGQVSTLDGLVAALQNSIGSATGGLPIIGGVTGTGGQPVGTTLVTSLTDLAAMLAAGQVPTGLSLAPVTALLREVAASVPEPLSSTITQLADAIDATTGQLGADLLGPLATVIGQIAGTAGVSPAAAAQLAPLAASLQRASSGAPLTTPKPAAKTVYSAAKMSKLRVDRKKGKLVVNLECTSVLNKCAAILTPLRGKSSAAKASIVMIPAGGSVTRKIALSKGVLRLMKRKTVKLTLVSYSQRGSKSSKSVTTKVPKKKH
jgi:hypothetical protein